MYTWNFLPKTIARVLVALRSFLAELFSLFFLLALLALYIVNFELELAFFLSFLLPDAVLDRTLEVLPNWRGSKDPVLLSLLSSCLVASFPFFFRSVCDPWMLVAAADPGLADGGGEDDVEDDGAEVIRGFGLGLEFVSVGSWIIVLLAAPS